MDTSLRNRFGPRVQSITLISAKERRMNPSRSGSSSQRRHKITSQNNYYKPEMKKGTIPEPESFENLQKKGQFLDYAEFNSILEGEHIITISHWRPLQDYPEDLREMFDARIKELVSTINRRFPFIKVLLKSILDTCTPLIEVQLCSFVAGSSKKYILGSMVVTGKLPQLDQVVNNIQRTLKTVDLQITIECNEKDVAIIGPVQTDKQLVEGLQVALRQKSETSQLIQTSVNTNESLMRQSRSTSSQRQISNGSVYSGTQASFTSSFLGQKSSMFATVTSCYSQASRSDSLSSASSPKRRDTSLGSKNKPVKVFSIKGKSNCNGNVVLKNIPVEIDQFVIEIIGSRQLKPFRQMISLQEMIDMEQDGSVHFLAHLEREDLTKGLIKVSPLSEASDSIVRIGNYEFWNKQNQPLALVSNLWFQEIQYDVIRQGFSFYSEPGTYFIEVEKEGFYPYQKQVHLKRGNYENSVQISSCTLVKLILHTKNLITQQLEGGFELSVCDEQGKELMKGFSNEYGQMEIDIQLIQLIRVFAVKSNYVEISQEIQLSAQQLEHDIFVIPQNENVQNRLDILIYEPNNSFSLEYNLSLPQKSQPLSISNNNDITYQATYDSITFKQYQSKLVGISINNTRNKSFQLSAYSIINKPNVKESWHQQMFSTNTQNKSAQNENFIDLYSKTQVLSDPNYQAKYDEHQKMGRNFCKAVQSIDGYFYGQRVSTHQLKMQQNLKEYTYLQKPLEKYTPEKSTRVYVIYDNKLLDILYIQQNILPEQRVLGTFVSSSKQFVKGGEANEPLLDKIEENRIARAQSPKVPFSKNGLNHSKEIFKDSKRAKFLPSEILAGKMVKAPRY